MSILYTGIDLIENTRIERAIDRWGERFLRRVFTPAELETYRGRTRSLAARWAAKEAAAKMLGVGLRGLGAATRPAGVVAWTDVEILSDGQGRLRASGFGLQHSSPRVPWHSRP